MREQNRELKMLLSAPSLPTPHSPCREALSSASPLLHHARIHPSSLGCGPFFCFTSTLTFPVLHDPTPGFRNQPLTRLFWFRNQYLTSKVNGQLYVPPTATIARVDG